VANIPDRLEADDVKQIKTTHPFGFDAADCVCVDTDLAFICGENAKKSIGIFDATTIDNDACKFGLLHIRTIGTLR